MPAHQVYFKCGSLKWSVHSLQAMQAVPVLPSILVPILPPS